MKKITIFCVLVSCFIFTQCSTTNLIWDISPNEVVAQSSQLNETQKQVNIVYFENQVPLSNKDIFLAYYDGTTKKKVINSSKTDNKGIVTFVIPSTNYLSSVPFYFWYNNIQDDNARIVFRLPAKSENNDVEEKAITLKVDKYYNFELQNGWVIMVLGGFPKDGTEIKHGGDIISFPEGSKYFYTGDGFKRYTK